MSHSQAGLQFENVTPPVGGKIVVLATDSTSRPYDLSLIDFPAPSTVGGEAYLTLIAETNAAYIAFGSATLTVDHSAAMSAGDAPTFTANAAWLLPVGQPLRVRVSRLPNSPHRWLAVRTASTGGILRLYVSSPNNA